MKDKKKLLYGFLFFALLFIFFTNKTGISTNANEVSPAPTAVPNKVSVSLNYLTEEITVVKGNGGSDKLYFSTDKKKTWELIEDANGKFKISGLMKTSALTIYFKGNKEPEPVELIIPAEDKTLKVTYSVVSGAGVIAYTTTPSALEYRIGANGNWNPVTASIDTKPYEVAGATLQFRTKATETARAGKIVSLKIAKRPKAPSVKIDGSKLELGGLKNDGTMQYRVTDAAGVSKGWTTFAPTDKKVKTISLANLLLASGSAVNTQIPAGTIELRIMPVKKYVASAIRTIEIAAQRPAPSAEKVNLNGTTLTITDASSAKPYEYLVLHTGQTPDLLKDKWKSVTSSKAQVIKKTGKADTIPGDVVFVREKAVKDKVTGIDSIASLYVSKIISSGVAPATPSAASAYRINL